MQRGADGCKGGGRGVIRRTPVPPPVEQRRGSGRGATLWAVWESVGWEGLCGKYGECKREGEVWVSVGWRG